jgi:phage repressor protein C with HTH and peptisase S24 domain
MDYRQLLRIMLQDTKQEDLAQELGTTQATISRWLSGQEPRGSALERIRSLARARRLAQDATIEPNDVTNQSSVFRASQMSSPHKSAKGKQAPQPRGDIANFTIHAGMGSGGTLSVTLDDEGEVIDPSDSDGFWSFPDQVKAGWRQMNQTYAMPVTGDSMEPTLNNGSYVFVDTSHKYPSPPDLYAVNYGHGLMVKRVELLPEDKIRIISDNDRYSDFEFHQQDVEVYGRVVASFQWRG